MANENKYLDKTGLSTLWERIKSYLTTNHIKPMASKTFTDILATTNDFANNTWYFGSIKPEVWQKTWRVKYRIRTYVPNYPTYNQVADVMVSGYQNVMVAYSSMNTVAANYPAYYHVLYRMKQAGFNNGYGHLLGVQFYSAQSPGYARTVEVDIISTENCTFQFFDDVVLYANASGTGTTNYDTYTQMNYVNNGLQQTGDANDVDYQNRIYYSSSKTKDPLYRYQIVLRDKDKKIVPVSLTNNAITDVNKTFSSSTFDPFGEIYYWSSASTYAADGNMSNGALYRQVLADLRYSFNLNASSGNYKLVARQPVYLTAELVGDRQAILAIPSGGIWGPITQTLPTSEDGLIYIYLGQAYQDTYPYRLELMLNHPVYQYKDGAIREINSNSIYLESKNYWKYNSTNETIELVFPE